MFTVELFHFFRDLKRHNDREWPREWARIRERVEIEGESLKRARGPAR